MLGLVAAPQASLNAGSVGLALARRWSDAGESVLLVDADLSGSRLAARVGAVERAEYLPEVRGLPSLMVTREPLTLESVAAHCYSLSPGSLWAMFAPFNPEGGELAAAWLADRAGDLQELNRQRRVVFASPMRPRDTVLVPLLEAASVLVVVAPLQSGEQAMELWRLLRGANLLGAGGPRRALVIEGRCSLDDDEIRAETGGMHVVGRLPVVDDDRVLRLQGSRRDKAFASELDHIAAQLLAASIFAEPAASPAGARGPAAGPDLGVLHDGAALPSDNGSTPAQGGPDVSSFELPGDLSEPHSLTEPLLGTE